MEFLTDLTKDVYLYILDSMKIFPFDCIELSVHIIKYLNNELKQEFIGMLRERGYKMKIVDIRNVNDIFKIASLLYIKNIHLKKWGNMTENIKPY